MQGLESSRPALCWIEGVAELTQARRNQWVLSSYVALLQGEIMIAVLLALTSAHAISYNAIGLCGETLSVEVTDATPGGYFTFMIGSGPGADAIPFGACAGTDTTLNVLTNSRVVRADDSGAFAMEWAMPEEFCGLSVAVLDMSTCGVSNVDVLGDPDLPVPDLFPGDLAILGMNADGDDDFAWVATVDIPAGLTVYFTDSGVYADGSLRDTEGTAEWFVEADVSAGTVFTASELGLAGSLAIASSGDQVIAYVGERGAPMGYVAALHSDGDGWVADASSSNDSALPPGLEDGLTAIAVTPEADNLLWVGDGRELTRDELLAYIHDAENWVTDNSDAYDMSAIEDGPVSELGPPAELIKWSEGTEEWPDQACNSVTSFGSCDTEAEEHSSAWATFVCQQNGYSFGEWTGAKIAGCAGETSVYCGGGSIPCEPNWEYACSEGDQTQIEVICYL